MLGAVPPSPLHGFVLGHKSGGNEIMIVIIMIIIA
jgi:hypothetical protein